MIKKNMMIIIVSLLLTSCAERGQPQVSQRIIDNNSTVKDGNIPTLTVRANNFDSIENKVSGGLILLIGVLILL